MEHFWVATQTPSAIAKYSGFSSSTQIDSIAIPGSFVTGLAWDGTDLYSADFSTGLIYKHDGLSASIQGNFAAEYSAEITAMAWDGQNIITSEGNSSSPIVVKYDGFSDTVLESFVATGGYIRGMAHDGTYLYTNRYAGGPVTRHSGFSNTAHSTITVTGSLQTGIGWDGTNLITYASATLRKHDGFSTTIAESFNAATTGGVWGIIFEDFFIVDKFTATLQYKNAGGSFVDVTSALGDIGADVKVGTRVAYWDNPSQDRADVEISDARVQLTFVPDGGNSDTHSANVTSATQLSTGDGTGTIGDVKVEYEIT